MFSGFTALGPFSVVFNNRARAFTTASAGLLVLADLRMRGPIKPEMIIHEVSARFHFFVEED